MTLFKEQEIKVNYKEVVKISSLKIAIFFLVIMTLAVIGAGVNYFLNDSTRYFYYLASAFPIVAIFFFLVKYYYKKYWTNYSYTLGEEEIVIQSGILNKVKTVVPYNVIQHINVEHGFIMRKYGYSELTVQLLIGLEKIEYIKTSDVERIKEEIIASKNRYKIKF